MAGETAIDVDVDDGNAPPAQQRRSKGTSTSQRSFASTFQPFRQKFVRQRDFLDEGSRQHSRPSMTTSGERSMEEGRHSSYEASDAWAGLPRVRRGTLDRGTGFYREERDKLKLPSLVETGRHAGKSRVEYVGVKKRRLLFHLIKRDFFISIVNSTVPVVFALVALTYLCAMFLFSGLWWAIVQLYGNGECLQPVKNFADIFIFSIITQTTIGYGNISIEGCWGGAALLVVHSLVGFILDSLVLGIVFARISHPKQRGRTIFISDSACISRRDGELKFTFRIADVRRTQVIEPKVFVYMYVWGEGRVTAEGEFIPVRSEPLQIGYIDGMLLLPVIIEHTIDERSPLFGHTHDSLMALQAEIVITFAGTTEFGSTFMVRQSYLPPEIHWGYQFDKVLQGCKPGDTQYTVDISRFHDVVPQKGLPMLLPHALSRLVVTRQVPTAPYPLLGQNTLVVSDSACVAPVDGELKLMWRVGDTYLNQMVEVHVRAYIYRWKGMGRESDGEGDYKMEELELGYRYKMGSDRLLLRLPHVVTHTIDDHSPLRNWHSEVGRTQDADSDIVFQVEGYWYCSSRNVLRMRTYNVLNSVRFGCKFVNIITPPQKTRDFKPRINWSRFHDVEPAPSSISHRPTDAPARTLQRLLSRASAGGNMPANAPVSPAIATDEDCGHMVVSGLSSNPLPLPDSGFPHSAENSIHSTVQSSMMGGGRKQLSLGREAGARAASAVGSYMGEVLGLGGELQRYTSTAGHVSREPTSEYDETLAVMNRSPEKRLHYSRLTSLFEAAAALQSQEEQTAAQGSPLQQSTLEMLTRSSSTPLIEGGSPHEHNAEGDPALESPFERDAVPNSQRKT